MTTGTDQKPGCFAVFWNLFRGKAKETKESLPYQLRKQFLTPAEVSFFHVLSSVVKTQVVICPKVRLGDIFYVRRSENSQKYWNRISQKHVDFLLCAPKSMRPILGIELDDSSHARSERKASDQIKDDAFAAVGLPLLRISQKRSYNTRELAAHLAPLLRNSVATKDAP